MWLIFFPPHWGSSVAAVSETNIGRSCWRKKSRGKVVLSHVLSVHIRGWFHNCLREDIFRPQSRTLLAWVVELGRKEEHWLLFILSWHRNQLFVSIRHVTEVLFVLGRYTWKQIAHVDSLDVYLIKSLQPSAKTFSSFELDLFRPRAPSFSSLTTFRPSRHQNPVTSTGAGRGRIKSYRCCASKALNSYGLERNLSHFHHLISSPAFVSLTVGFYGSLGFALTFSKSFEATCTCCVGRRRRRCCFPSDLSAAVTSGVAFRSQSRVKRNGLGDLVTWLPRNPWTQTLVI